MMNFNAGLLVFAACMPYVAWAGAAAAASAVAVASTPVIRGPKCACNYDYNPVCGTDGYTYSNECFLRCISAENVLNGRPAIAVWRRGVCPARSCGCPRIYNPICGSNNQTYANDCLLRCENNWRAQYGLPRITIMYRGECTSSACICPQDVVPVCGSDGKTYRNLCVMSCYSRANIAQGLPPITLKEPNACANEVCICPKIKNELCASDDNTYANDCLLACQNRRRSQLGLPALTVQYRGACVRCACTADYSPVCASNDVTYTNYCVFLCENEKRRRAGLPELLLRWKGECNCGCTREYRPLCGNNGRTYSNPCWLRCENRKRYQDGKPLVFEAHSGSCTGCNCGGCWAGLRMVCASDSRTYRNMCYLNCESDCRAKAGLSRLYVVKQGPC